MEISGSRLTCNFYSFSELRKDPTNLAVSRNFRHLYAEIVVGLEQTNQVYPDLPLIKLSFLEICSLSGILVDEPPSNRPSGSFKMRLDQLSDVKVD